MKGENLPALLPDAFLKAVLDEDLETAKIIVTSFDDAVLAQYQLRAVQVDGALAPELNEGANFALRFRGPTGQQKSTPKLCELLFWRND